MAATATIGTVSSNSPVLSLLHHLVIIQSTGSYSGYLNMLVELFHVVS